MLYYYNRDGIFQKESSKEYKTQKGAVDRLTKEGEGAVYDETGKLIISLTDKVPEDALNTNEDGSVPAYNENNEQIGTVDAETVAEATGESVSNAEPSEGETDKQEQTEEPWDGFNETTDGGIIPREREEQTGTPSFDVETTCDSLRIRAGAGKDYRIVGYIREKAGNKKKHTIEKEKNGWGRLANGEGWIELAYTKTVG